MMFKWGVILFYAGAIFNFLETWYFGWNRKPLTPEEMICDWVAFCVMLGGVFMVVKSLLDKKFQQLINTTGPIYMHNVPVVVERHEMQDIPGRKS